MTDNAKVEPTDNGFEVKDSTQSYGTYQNIVQAQVKQVAVNSEKAIRASKENQLRKYLDQP